MKTKGKPLPGLRHSCPKAEHSCSSSSAAETKEEADRQGEKALRWTSRATRQPAPRSCSSQKVGGPEAVEVRESGLGATRVPGKAPDTWPGWEDAAVPPAQTRRIPPRLRRALQQRYRVLAVLYGHFGQGCIHAAIELRSRIPPTASRSGASSSTEAADLVSRTAARCPASTATGRRAANSCR